MRTIVPLLLAGGSGTRLWPLSRKRFPKQFARLLGGTTLFQNTVQRLSGQGFAPPLVVTGPDFRFEATAQLAEAGGRGGTVLIEPEGRNTAPAVLAGALWLAQRQPDALMLVAPSDHAISNAAAFARAVEAGHAAARAGALVTFGITPTRPETGYGYLELAEQGAPGQVTPLKRFVEKPDVPRAKQMLEAGNYLWNAGIFLFSVQAILDAFDTHAPDMVQAVSRSVEGASADLDFFRLEPEAWGQVADVSLDYAIMEKAEGLVVVPFDGGWSDLGDWGEVARGMDRDAGGNALSGSARVIDCENTMIRAEDDGVEVVGIGLRDLAVVSTRDAVLVADLAHSQRVKDAVATLRDAGARQATEFAWDRRPWGSFESLARGRRFQVKRIVVKPGGHLSLQSHHHRAEHWIVVEGTAKVTIGEEVRLLSENESVYIPLGAVHRLENPGKVPMVLIEVQTGSYLGEDDIVRYEDSYNRD